MNDHSEFKPLWICIGALGFLLAMGWAGNSDYEHALLEEQGYCANVTLYHATRGEHGWPDYRELYSTMCAKYADNPELFFQG